MKQYYPQEIRIKSPHLLRIRNDNDNHQRLHLVKANLIESNGQKYFAFNHNGNKNEGVKLLQPVYTPQIVSTLQENYKKAVNKTQFDQIKELTTLESGGNHLKYRKIKHDKVKELRRNKNSQMNTITSQGTHDLYKEKRKEKRDKDKQNSSIRKKREDASSNQETYNTNLMTRSKSVCSKMSKECLNLSQSRQLKRSNSNKKDALRILDETIKGLTKLKTIILDDEEEDEEEELVLGRNHYSKRQFSNHLQNGIQHVKELINNSFTRESLSRLKLKDKKITITPIDNQKRTNSDFKKPKVKKRKIFIDLEKQYNHFNDNKSNNNTKNTFLIGAHRNIVHKRKQSNEIQTFDQEFLMTTFFNRFKNTTTTNKSKPNKATKITNKSSITAIKKKNQRYDSDTDPLANFEFSD